jgi:putative exosortase-associated protein (TIGR04073 family)
MRKTLSLLASLSLVAVWGAGCAGPEQKMGRGFSNMYEIVRGGEMERSIEQTTLFDGPDAGMTLGVVRGFNRTMARTGIGLYEVFTAPIPPYDPIHTRYLTPSPVYPDSYHPGHVADSIFATDRSDGFSGGDVAPFIPGSRFRIFDN